MSEHQSRAGSVKLLMLATCSILIVVLAGWAIWVRYPGVGPDISDQNSHPENADIGYRVQRFCGACQAYPPPDTFPRFALQKEVARGYRFYEDSDRHLDAPPLTEVVKYYEAMAPEKLPEADIKGASTPLPIQFKTVSWPGPGKANQHTVSNVNLVHLSDAKRLDILACDMASHEILTLQPQAANPTWQVLGKGKHPAHVEAIDLDGDGIKDILVANLGNFPPTDRLCGSVQLLRGRPDGTYAPHILLEGVGRVADVQAGDFRGIGKLDLIVAEIGYLKSGQILYLENQTTDWNKPHFVKRVLDTRHGTICVPVIDLNGDGKPDFIALISQEHETVVAFINKGDGTFREETIYTAPHPAMGSSSLTVVDTSVCRAAQRRANSELQGGNTPALTHWCQLQQGNRVEREK